MYISINHVTKHFRGKPKALDDVTIDLPTGMIGLLGSNGAGKTTLMRMLCGIIQPTEGKVLVDGQDLRASASRRAVKSTLGYLPQHVEPYPNLTPLEFLDYVGILKGIDRRSARRSQAEALVARVGLTDAKNRRIGGFSGGMRRRVGIAQALMGDPRLIIVDEPTAGLDPEERIRFRTLLAGLGAERTVILSTHILDDVAQTCPYIFVLGHGRTRYDGPTGGLIEAARGRTWLTDPRNARLPENAAVVNALTASGGTQYRIVTDTPPEGAEPVEPNLEDGYMALAVNKETP